MLAPKCSVQQNKNSHNGKVSEMVMESYKEAYCFKILCNRSSRLFQTNLHPQEGLAKQNRSETELNDSPGDTQAPTRRGDQVCRSQEKTCGGPMATQKRRPSSHYFFEVSLNFKFKFKDDGF